MKYQLYREQRIRCDIQTAWEFFSNPINLSKITPKDVGFVVLTEVGDKAIYEGMEIDYTVSPLLGIPLKWKTRITHVLYQKSFTDLQIIGPYKLWNHFHEFYQEGEDVLMKDTVDYELPMGFLGTIAHQLFVQKKLENIFNYRFSVLEKMFNQHNSAK